MRRTSRSTSWRSSTNSPSSKPSSHRTRRPSRRPCSKPPKNYETTSRTSMTSSGPCATTSTGNRTASTSPCAPRRRSLFDALDGIDEVTDQTGAVQVNTDKLADLAPKLTALLPQTIATMKASRDLSLATYNSQKALYRPDGGLQRHRPGDGAELRPGQERRPVLPAPGGFSEPRLRTRPEDVPLTGRQVRPHVHHPRDRPRDTGGHRPGRQRRGRPRRRP